MGSRKLFWRFSNQDKHRRTPPEASSSASYITTSPSAEMTVEFLCPISRSLMADPVIVPPSGHSFERSCIQACADLGFTPSGLGIDLSTSPALVLVPNVALKSAILRWCERSGIPPPLPIPDDAARALVRQLMPPSSNPPPFPLPTPADATSGNGRRSQRAEVLRRFAAFSVDEAEELEKGEAFRAQEYARDRGEVSKGTVMMDSYSGNGERRDSLRASSTFSDENDGSFSSRSRRPDQSQREGTTPSIPSAFSVRTKKQASYTSPHSISSGSSNQYSSSNSSVNEVVEEETAKKPSPPRVHNEMPSDLCPSPTAEIDLSEEETIVIELMSTEVSEQESAVVSLRQATRESRERRISLCTPRLLAALRPMLLSRSDTVQVSAAASLVNLSLEPANRVRIAKSGAVLPLVDVVKGGRPEARDHAAAALFSLALEEENRAAIGVLGAIPPLLNLFSDISGNSASGRRDAGMALYYLSLTSANRSKIARAPGAVQALFSVASEREQTPPQQGPSLARLSMMVVCNLAGSNEGRAALMDGGGVASVVSLMRSPSGAAEEEYCVAALYGMSRGSLRFRGLARSAGAERELMRVAEGSGGGGDMRQKMAKKTLRAMRGEDEEEAAPPPPIAFSTEDEGSVVSEGLMSFRRRPNHYGNTRLNTTEF
ncbi:hypothetical protein Cni_G22589 [Canna indica]|uniref:RING-type E3 ubiquitin transferase n=1 Tax=Canna indica TaxID=4628 RepID=A0AAQ3KS32_9LILI|nr:hypothetical protein Cni_G22589 [Canna indica]